MGISEQVDKVKEGMKKTLKKDFPKDSPKMEEEKQAIAKKVKKLKSALINKSALKYEKKVIKMKIDALKSMPGSSASVAKLQGKLSNVMAKQEEAKEKSAELKSNVKTMIRKAEVKGEKEKEKKEEEDEEKKKEEEEDEEEK